MEIPANAVFSVPIPSLNAFGTTTSSQSYTVCPQNSIFHALFSASMVLYRSFNHTRNAFWQFSQKQVTPYSLLMCQQVTCGLDA